MTICHRWSAKITDKFIEYSPCCHTCAHTFSINLSKNAEKTNHDKMPAEKSTGECNKFHFCSYVFCCICSDFLLSVLFSLQQSNWATSAIGNKRNGIRNRNDANKYGVAVVVLPSLLSACIRSRQTYHPYEISLYCVGLKRSYKIHMSIEKWKIY